MLCCKVAIYSSLISLQYLCLLLSTPTFSGMLNYVTNEQILIPIKLTTKATQNKTLVSQAFICEKQSGNAAINFLLFHAASKQYTPVYMPAMCQYTNNDNDLYRNLTQKLDNNVHAGNKNDVGRPEMKQDLVLYFVA